MSVLIIDKRAEPHIRALARAIGWERREVIQALQAHAEIPQAEHKTPQAPQRWLFALAPVAPKPMPKDPPRRSEPYRRWVASLPCAHCGIAGLSNACHGDAGKGLSIKSGDDTCWPGCVDRPGQTGCHTLMGATGKLGRAERRRLERAYAAQTQRTARETGNWPKEWD